MIADLVIICKKNLIFSIVFYKSIKQENTGTDGEGHHLTNNTPYNILFDCKWLGWEAVHIHLEHREPPVGAKADFNGVEVVPELRFRNQ